MDLSKASGHDNILLSYCVDAEKKEIRLNTSHYSYAKPDWFQNFIFTGVVAYHFESDLLSNIIHDITEVTLKSIYDDDVELFQRLKNHGWPMVQVRWETAEELLSYLHTQETRGFKLVSTMGLDGWVWAQNCVVEETAPA